MRILLLVLLISLMFPSVASSQGEWSTFHSPDGKLSFDYPDMWKVKEDSTFVESNEQKYVVLSTPDINYYEFSRKYPQLEPGQGILSISILSEPQDKADMAIVGLLEESTPDFLLGYYTAAFIASMSFGVAFPGREPAKILAIDDVTISENHGKFIEAIANDNLYILAVTKLDNQTLLLVEVGVNQADLEWGEELSDIFFKSIIYEKEG